ncbi:hypothetical protein KFK09_000118 [Dendrobium nobile]|uniref:Cytochrome P450 n=1 Tax=Dendrobium nobile TaxID=94219 RepID=A0A8T3C7M2_DENNO|nr:hypothetical protein KFK09_000118 [Dendrobium nobile]
MDSCFAPSCDFRISPSSSLLPFAAAAAAAAAAIIIIIIIISKTFFRLPSSPPLPPCPFRLPIVGNLPFLDPNLHSCFAQLSSTHGPIFRLHLGSKLAIVITSPSLSRQILRDHDPTFANRDVPAAASVISYGGSDIVWNPIGPTWRMLRRICVREMLSPTNLDAVYHLRRRELRSAIRQIQSAAISGEVVDVGAEMFLTVLNIITSMLWGGTMEGEEERSAVGKMFRHLVGEITELLGLPNVSDFFPAMSRFDLQGIERKMRVLLERFDGIFARIIEMKREKRLTDEKKVEEKMDFLDYMLMLEEKGNESKEPFTFTHVKALLMDMVVGGTETSSNTIEFAMAEMMNKPETIKQAQEELDKVVGRDNVIEESHLPNLHYLNMVLKEVLRLHPALPLLVPHCPSSPCSIGGFAVPKGSRVFINVWAIHRDETMWKDPLEFKPERWSYGDAAGSGEFSYFPFGSGRRICAGISMAERMVLYSLASLLHSFDWKMPQGITEMDLSEKFGIVLKKAKPLVLLPVPRLSNPQLYS